MSFIVSEVYDALVAAGTPEEKAKAAAAAIPVVENLATKDDIAGIRQDLAASRLANKDDIAALRQELAALKLDDIAGIKQDLTALKRKRNERPIFLTPVSRG